MDVDVRGSAAATLAPAVVIDDAGELWLTAASDLLIAASYFAIPMLLIYFASRYTDLVGALRASERLLVALFAAFITLCGLTHAINIYATFVNRWLVLGVVKVATAAVSLATAAALLVVIPGAPPAAASAAASDAHGSPRRAHGGQAQV